MNQKITNLSVLIKDTDENMRKFGYTDYSMTRFHSGWNKLVRYSEAIGNPPYTPFIGLEFLRKETGYPHVLPYRQSQKSSLAIRSVRLLNEYQECQTIAGRIPLSKTTWSEPISAIRENYFRYCRERELSESTVRVRKDAIDQFLRVVIMDKGYEFETINAKTISEYIMTFSGFAPNTVAIYLRGLRKFFEFLYERGYVETNLGLFVPKMKSRKPERIPSIMKKEDLNKLLTSVDRGNPLGKRDYAILVTAALLGLRGCDICALTFDNLNWDAKRIELIQRKTGEPLYLPMLVQVRDAIVDYMRNGRPVTESQNVFIKHNAPYDGLVNLHSIMEKHTHLAGIKMDAMQLKGLHILRHTLASGLIMQGEAYGTVSAALGHKNTKSTDTYAHIDVEGLIQCALEPWEVGFSESN